MINLKTAKAIGLAPPGLVEPRPMIAMPVFYRDEMVADAHSFSPSAGKPKDVVASWKQQGIPISVLPPEPVTRGELYRAHDTQYLDDVLDLRKPNGFSNRSGDVARSLIYTSGAMLNAAKGSHPEWA